MSITIDETELRIKELKALIEAYRILDIDPIRKHNLNPDDFENWKTELEELTRDEKYKNVVPDNWDVSVAKSSLTYQGEKEIDITTHPDYKDMTTIDWCLYFIERY